jgi:GNAT superfamily N-acetyltransferase
MGLEAYSDDELMGMLGDERPANDLSSYSDDELMEMAGTKPPEKPGLLSRMGTDIGKAYTELTTPLESEGGMTDLLPRIGEKALRTAGHLGSAAGEVFMEGAKGLYNLTTSPYTRENIKDAFSYLANTDIGKAQIETGKGLANAYKSLKKEYPRAAEDIEAGASALNLIPAYQIGKAAVPAATAISGGIVRTPKAIKNALYPEPTFDEAIGQVLQGKTKDIPKGKKALSAIDTSDVNTYAELGKKIDDAIPNYAKQVDAELLKDPVVYPLDDLSTIKTTKGGSRVSNNYVEDSIDHLEELYIKTGDSVKAVEMGELRARASENGLTKKEVNDIARTYNSEFKDKAFSKANDEPLTSVNAQAYQNTRQGLKEVARRGLDDTAKELDSTISSLYNTKRLIDKNVEAANRLRQKVDERGLGEKIGRAALVAIDVATMGTLKGAFLKMLPRGLGYKTKNFIDLEESLSRNLRIINKELNRIEKVSSPEPTGPVAGPPPRSDSGSGYIPDPYRNRPPTYDAVYDESLLPNSPPRLPGPQGLLPEPPPSRPIPPRPGTEPPTPIVQPGATSGGKQPLSVEKAQYNGKTHLIMKEGRKDVGEIAFIERADGNAEISNVLVQPAFQRQGQGTELYRKAFDEAQAQGKKLFISNDRTPDAIKLHEQFSKKGILKADGEISFESPSPLPEVGAVSAKDAAYETRRAALQDLTKLRESKPRPIEKRFGTDGPNPEQKVAYDAEVKDWNRRYREANKAFKEADTAEANLSKKTETGMTAREAREIFKRNP